jgi:hypothetical protein
MKTLTQVQEAAVAYAAASRPTVRTELKAIKMVREFCEKMGFTAEQTRLCCCDMWDMVKLARMAE